jgi:phage recombination protein Bet
VRLNNSAENQKEKQMSIPQTVKPGVQTTAQTATQIQATQQTDFERLLDKKSVSYVPFGGQDTLKLNVKNVQELIAVKTTSGKTCSENDALKFMAMCQALRLNPYAGDAYMIGYDSKDGPKFSLITAHAAFLKRAEVHPQYDGMESGVILMNDGGDIEERQGDFHLPEETIVGGWARVFCKDRTHPTYRRLRMTRFNRGFGVWKEDAAGMIVKCAEADALRSTFPTMVGGLYLREELDFMPDAASMLPVSKPLFESPLKTSKPVQTAQKVSEEAVKLPGELLQKTAQAEDVLSENEGPQSDVPAAPTDTHEPRAVSASGHSYNPLKAIRALLCATRIKEGALVDYLADTGATDGSFGSLDEIQLAHDGLIQSLCENWEEFLVKFNEAKGKR